MKICPNCGNQYNNDDEFCAICGSRLNFVNMQDQGNDIYKESSASLSPMHNNQLMNGNAPQPNVQKNNSVKIAIIILSVFLMIVLIGVGVFLIKHFVIDKRNPNTEVEASVTSEQISGENETKKITETATAATATTAKSPSIDVITSSPHIEDEKNNIDENIAYSTFGAFYESYIDAINAMDADLMYSCSIDVRDQMANRFSTNKNSIFDLARIDYDVDSYTYSSNGSSTTATFYVKCVTEMYNRNTNEDKGLNYAVWRTTVINQNGSYAVVGMERDDAYKLSSNVISESY